jgi:DSC E3 ubiquitin ligase complex subunit 3-like protein
VEEVDDLRSAFIVRLEHTHPVAVPSSSSLELRALEDAWLDSTHFGRGTSTENGWEIDAEEEDEVRARDDRLIGSMIGFFWPVVGWMAVRRQDGREGWSERRMLGIILGVLINLLFGLLRSISVPMDDAGERYSHGVDDHIK